MAEQNVQSQQQTQQPPQAQHCTGNCMKCIPFQRAYCSAQITYSNMKILEHMEQTLSNIQEALQALNARIAQAMDDGAARIFDPTTATAADDNQDAMRKSKK